MENLSLGQNSKNAELEMTSRQLWSDMQVQLPKLKLLIVFIVFQFLGAGLSEANPISPNQFIPASTDLSAIKAPGETVVFSNQQIFSSGLGVNNVFVSTGLDLNLAQTNSEILDPENYSIGPGLLLQANSGTVGISGSDPTFEVPLVTLLDQYGLIGPVMDSAGISFDFTVPGGHDVLSVDFILFSQEFHEGDWDLAAIFINGVNYATLPDRPYLRVNGSVGITDICELGNPSGCFQSLHAVNGLQNVGSITKRLTMLAPVSSGTNTFMASVANTTDNFYATALHLSNFYTFQEQGGSIATFGIQIPAKKEDPVPDFVFLNSPNDLTSRARINKDGNRLICSAGKYQFGLPGSFSDVDFNDVTYQLLVDGNLVDKIGADASSVSWDTSTLSVKGLATCSISLSYGGLTLFDRSDVDNNLFSTASATKASQKLSASSARSKELQDALVALANTRKEIRGDYRNQRLIMNKEFSQATQELKSELESGEITPRQYTTSIKAANAEYREKTSEMYSSYKSALAENALESIKATSQYESQLIEAFKAIDATYAQTLEKAGYGVVLD